MSASEELGVNCEYLRVLLFRAKKSFKAYLEQQASERPGRHHCVETLEQYQASQIAWDRGRVAVEK